MIVYYISETGQTVMREIDPGFVPGCRDRVEIDQTVYVVQSVKYIPKEETVIILLDFGIGIE